mmetsp:Transcript_26870/g.79772  ORF Transcript_26870/g.79772 Transcript_26870/m.79772 type:complete len:239 (-) Transcript_26870:116-832(-)
MVCVVASHRLAPIASCHSIAAQWIVRSSSTVLSPKATDDVQLPSSMPSSGMMYCASHQGSSVSTTITTYDRTMPALSAIDASVLRKRPLYVCWGRAVASIAATSVMNKPYNKTIHATSTSKMGLRMKLRMVSWTHILMDATTSWLLIPRSKKMLTSALISKMPADIATACGDSLTAPAGCGGSVEFVNGISACGSQPASPSPIACHSGAPSTSTKAMSTCLSGARDPGGSAAPRPLHP